MTFLWNYSLHRSSTKICKNDRIFSDFTVKFYYFPRRCAVHLRNMTPFPLLPLRFHSSGFTYTHYCRSVSSFSNAKAGIPDSLCAAGTAMSLCIERVQKSAENEYSSGNGHFSRPAHEFPSDLFGTSKFLFHWCNMYVCNVIRDWSVFIQSANVTEILSTKRAGYK